MATIAGADGCKTGWVVVSQDMHSNAVELQVVSSIREWILRRDPPEVLAIDVPIGLPDSGPRACDLVARKLLGRPRGSSVFPAPIRPVLEADSHAVACSIGRKSDGRGISVQCWSIVPKIREIDQLLRSQPEWRRFIREVHPEVSFMELNNGKPMQYSKARATGRHEREMLLEALFGDEFRRVMREGRETLAQPDDVIDAFAALWSARRVRKGCFRRLPDEVCRDSYGLRMEILA